MQAECVETESGVIYIDIQRDEELARKALISCGYEFQPSERR